MLASHGILRHDHSQRRAWIPRLAAFHREAGDRGLLAQWQQPRFRSWFIERGTRTDRLPSVPQARYQEPHFETRRYLAASTSAAPPCRIFLTRMETALGGQHANGPSDRTSASSRPSLARSSALGVDRSTTGLTRTVECTAVRFCLVERDPASLGRGRGWHGTARSLACRPSASPRTLGRTVEWLRSRFIPRRKLNTSTSWHGISSEVLRRLSASSPPSIRPSKRSAPSRNVSFMRRHPSLCSPEALSLQSDLSIGW